jgi:hypothetical protein
VGGLDNTILADLQGQRGLQNAPPWEEMRKQICLGCWIADAQGRALFARSSRWLLTASLAELFVSGARGVYVFVGCDWR